MSFENMCILKHVSVKDMWTCVIEHMHERIHLIMEPDSNLVAPLNEVEVVYQIGRKNCNTCTNTAHCIHFQLHGDCSNLFMVNGVMLPVVCFC